MIRGLAILREQLETLICSYSVLKIEVRLFLEKSFANLLMELKTLINDCGADSAQPRDWPRLKSLFLAHNFIDRIDQSLVSSINSHLQYSNPMSFRDIYPSSKYLI